VLLLNSKKVKNLKKLLLGHPGEEEVSLVFAGSSKTIKLPIKIKWSDSLAKKIEDVLK